MSHLSLTGRRILELGGYIASPYAGNLLAHLGGDVIKVEPFAGDPTRSMFRGGPGGTFIAYSQGKRSVCIDLTCATGHEVFERLLRTTDVIVHNLSPSATRRLKVTHEDCHRANPEIVYCHITGYGPGPRQDEIASNPIVEAATGVMYANRVDGRPTRLGPSYHDMFAGANAVIGILATLMSQEGNVQYRRLEVGLYETALHVAARDMVGAALNARIPREQKRAKSTEFGQPGYGAYKTADERWIYLLILNDNHWRRFCEVMALSEGTDPAIRTAGQRRERSAELEALVSAIIASRSFEENVALLKSAGLGFTEVKRYREALDDPQAREPGKISEFSFQGHTYTVPASPILSETPDPGLKLPPPGLGEHTQEVVRSLGYDTAAYEDLLRRGAVAGPDELTQATASTSHPDASA